MRNGVVAAFLGALLFLPASLRAAEPHVAVVVVGGDDARAGDSQREIESGLARNPSVRAALLPSGELPASALIPEAASAPDDAFQKAIDSAKQAYFDDKLDQMVPDLEQAEHLLNADAPTAARDRWMLQLWYVALSLSQSKNADAESHAAMAAAISSAPVPVDTFPPAVAALVGSQRAKLARVALKITASPAKLATIAVDDGAPVSGAQPLSLPLLEGRHWIRVAAAGYRGYTMEVTLKAGAPAPALDLWLAPSVDGALAQKAEAFVRGEGAGDAASFGAFTRALAPDLSEIVFAVPAANGAWQARVWRAQGEAWDATPHLPELGHEVLAALPHPAVAVGGGAVEAPSGGGEARGASSSSMGDVSAGLLIGGRMRSIRSLPGGKVLNLNFATGGAQLGWDDAFGSIGIHARAQIAQLGLFGDTTKIIPQNPTAPAVQTRASAPFVHVALDGTWAFGTGFAGARLGYESLAKDAAPATYGDASAGGKENIFPKYSLLQLGPTGGVALPAGPGRLRIDAAALFGSYSEGSPRTSATAKSTTAIEGDLGIEAAFPVGQGGWTLLAGANAGYRLMHFAGESQVMVPNGDTGRSGVGIDEALLGGAVSLSRRF